MSRDTSSYYPIWNWVHSFKFAVGICRGMAAVRWSWHLFRQPTLPRIPMIMYTSVSSRSLLMEEEVVLLRRDGAHPQSPFSLASRSSWNSPWTTWASFLFGCIAMVLMWMVALHVTVSDVQQLDIWYICCYQINPTRELPLIADWWSLVVVAVEYCVHHDLRWRLSTLYGITESLSTTQMQSCSDS